MSKGSTARTERPLSRMRMQQQGCKIVHTPLNGSNQSGDDDDDPGFGLHHDAVPHPCFLTFPWWALSDIVCLSLACRWRKQVAPTSPSTWTSICLVCVSVLNAWVKLRCVLRETKRCGVEEERERERERGRRRTSRRDRRRSRTARYIKAREETENGASRKPDTSLIALPVCSQTERQPPGARRSPRL